WLRRGGYVALLVTLSRFTSLAIAASVRFPFQTFDESRSLRCSHSLSLLPVAGDNDVSGNTGLRRASMTDFGDSNDPASKPSNKNSAVRLAAYGASNGHGVSRRVNKITQEICTLRCEVKRRSGICY